MKNNKKTIRTIIGAIIGFAAVFMAMQFVFKKPSLSLRLLESATQINKQTPMKVDEFTQLDSAAVSPPDTFIYYYSLTDLTKNEIILDTINKYVRPEIINNAKTNPEMQELRELKVTLAYRYYDKEGAFVWALDVTPDLYKL